MLNTRGVQITWLGHAAFRVRSGGKVFYLDPLLSANPLCPEAEKSPQACDAILLSHGHSDHVGDTVALAQRTGAQVVAMVELGNFLAAQGVSKDKIVAANKGGTFPVAGAKVTMVHADHSSSVDHNGAPVYLGEPAGYVVEFAEGLRVYFAGDTAVFGDMRLIGEIYQPDAAALPIGGFYTMDPREAAVACRLLGVPAVIPIHFGTWPVLAGTPEQLRQNLNAAGTPCEVMELRPGQTLND